MKKSEVILDEPTLAAYIADELPKEVRAAVTEALVRDPEARELLSMAIQALQVAEAKPRTLTPSDGDDRNAERVAQSRPHRLDEKRKAVGGS